MRGWTRDICDYYQNNDFYQISWMCQTVDQSHTQIPPKIYHKRFGDQSRDQKLLMFHIRDATEDVYGKSRRKWKS